MEELLNTALVEAVAIAAFVGIILESVKRAVLPNERFEKALPVISLVIGVAIGLLYAVVRSEDLLLYSASGLVGGGFASGVYDSIHTWKKDKKGI